MKRIRKRALFIVCPIVIILILTIVFHMSNQDKDSRFPMCQEITEEREILQDVSVLYLEKAVEGDTEYYKIQLEIRNDSSHEIQFGEKFSLDYQKNEQWVCVYQPPVTRPYTILLAQGKVQKMTFYLPESALRESGSYRLYLTGVGYCTLDEA